ncbi:hypothetical protein AX774_g7850 [Zancudomyces culisetae]|uniref:Uncharacterized protein n=1 Tax=Zancudomyces culisetae TaxID=1213189 RepID=A0A1R1PCQ4_ZANCU|nr:hypothetical protein AX774_g7850 [Zancudomyces culisetae]|eukprot:OMH78754.1 hypothetical protein AX774_g7850 [Zancudomyces culisetae]
MRTILPLILVPYTIGAAVLTTSCREKSAWCTNNDGTGREFEYCHNGEISKDSCTIGTFCSKVGTGIECIKTKSTDIIENQGLLRRRDRLNDIRKSVFYRTMRTLNSGIAAGSSQKTGKILDTLSSQLKNDTSDFSLYLETLNTSFEDNSDTVAVTLDRSIEIFTNGTDSSTQKVSTALRALSGNEKKASDTFAVLFNSVKSNDQLKNQFNNFLSAFNRQVITNRSFKINSTNIEPVANKFDTTLSKVFGCSSGFAKALTDNGGGSSFGEIVQSYFNGDDHTVTLFVDTFASFVSLASGEPTPVMNTALNILSGKKLGVVSQVLPFLLGQTQKMSTDLPNLVDSYLDFLNAISSLIEPIIKDIVATSALDGLCASDVIYTLISTISISVSMGITTF